MSDSFWVTVAQIGGTFLAAAGGGVGGIYLTQRLKSKETKKCINTAVEIAGTHDGHAGENLIGLGEDTEKLMDKVHRLQDMMITKGQQLFAH